MSEEEKGKYIIKLRGLPWNVTSQDIIDFLKACNIKNGEKGIHLITSPRDGRPNGEAFIELESESDNTLAFDYNKKILGHRYIEIFAAKLGEFDYVMKKQNVVHQDTYIKLRGLPYSCSYGEIEQFFEGLELKNGRDGIHIVLDSRGNTTGEAYVQFVSAEDTEKALKKNRDKIGHRYIEIFRSTAPEVRRAMLFYRPSSFDRNDRNSNGGGPRSTTGRNNSRSVRDRPYDNPWAGNVSPWRNRNMNNNNNNNNQNSNNNNNNNNNNNMSNNNSSSNSSSNNGNGHNNNNNNTNNNNNQNNNHNFNGMNQGNNFLDFITDTLFGNFANNFDTNNSSNDFHNVSNSNGNNNFLNDSFSERNGFDNFNNSNIRLTNSYERFFNDNNNVCNNNNSNNNNNNGNHTNGNNGNSNNNNNNNSNMNNNNNNNNNNSNNNGLWEPRNSVHTVHMRGLPYDCGEKSIVEFFHPMRPVNCEVQYVRGRHSGEAVAYFDTFDDAQQAMKRHKNKMGNRYIELFLNKAPGRGQSDNFFGIGKRNGSFNNGSGKRFK